MAELDFLVLKFLSHRSCNARERALLRNQQKWGSYSSNDWSVLPPLVSPREQPVVFCCQTPYRKLGGKTTLKRTGCSRARQAGGLHLPPTWNLQLLQNRRKKGTPSSREAKSSSWQSHFREAPFLHLWSQLRTLWGGHGEHSFLVWWLRWRLGDQMAMYLALLSHGLFFLILKKYNI